MSDYLPLEECKDGYLYRIKSRNLISGIYRAKTNGFVGVREKFGHEYLFEEYHWDTGAPFGTVKPIEEIEKAPDWDLTETTTWKGRDPETGEDTFTYATCDPDEVMAYIHKVTGEYLVAKKHK
jgi:hypothetical protein